MRLIDADALIKIIKEDTCNPCKEYYADNSGQRCPLCIAGDCLKAIEQQPTIEERREGDLISRKVAADVVDFECGEWRGLAKTIIDKLEALPSAQTESLTDKEQRIFLAAMGREEKICKQVDDEHGDCREPYDDSLMWVCKEIKRKVKGALWT